MIVMQVCLLYLGSCKLQLCGYINNSYFVIKSNLKNDKKVVRQSLYFIVCLSDECMISVYILYRFENSVTVELNRMIQ